jgi:hypothetical protein
LLDDASTTNATPREESGDEYFSPADALRYEEEAYVPPVRWCGEGTITTVSEIVEPSAPLRWKRGERLGRGAYGTVYLGLNCDTGELMAVKQVPLTGDDSGSIAKVRRNRWGIFVIFFCFFMNYFD